MRGCGKSKRSGGDVLLEVAGEHRGGFLLGGEHLAQVFLGLGQAGAPFGLAGLGAATLVVQSWLEAGDRGQRLGLVGLVAGRAPEAVEPLEIIPAETAGRATAPARGIGDDQRDAERPRRQPAAAGRLLD